MANVLAGLVAQDSVTLVVDGHTVAITDAHMNYNEIRNLVGKARYSEIGRLLDVAGEINTYGQGVVTVKDGVVFYMDEPTHNAVTDRILQMIDEGLEVTPMLRFLENLMDNPSKRSVDQLYSFLEVNDLPITEDGYFLAYKMVRNNFTDHRTGKFDYSVGAPPAKMRRNEVDEDPNRTCSNGLHVCAQGYLGFYGGGGRTILVKVNPRDVVAVPIDYKNAKMRVCEHVTVCEVDPTTKGNVFTSAVYKPVDTVSADNDSVLTVEEAMMHFYGNTDPSSRAALRKRLNRGVTCKRSYRNGVEVVLLLDDADAAEPVKDDTVSLDDAMIKLYGVVAPDTRSALRKRLDRGVTVERVYAANGEERVRFLAD